MISTLILIGIVAVTIIVLDILAIQVGISLASRQRAKVSSPPAKQPGSGIAAVVQGATLARMTFFVVAFVPLLIMAYFLSKSFVGFVLIGSLMLVPTLFASIRLFRSHV